MKRVKIYVFDVDGTLIPQSILFKLIDKTNAITSLSYIANRCYEKKNKLICCFINAVNDAISYLDSYFAKDRVSCCSYLKFFEKFIEIENKNSSLFFIVTASYKYKFFDLHNLGIKIFWIPKPKKIEFFKLLEKILEKYKNKFFFEIYQFNDDIKEIYHFFYFNSKGFLVRNWKETYRILSKILYNVS